VDLLALETLDMLRQSLKKSSFLEKVNNFVSFMYVELMKILLVSMESGPFSQKVSI
jgi:hypothetical protein